MRNKHTDKVVWVFGVCGRRVVFVWVGDFFGFVLLFFCFGLVWFGFFLQDRRGNQNNCMRKYNDENPTLTESVKFAWSDSVYVK